MKSNFEMSSNADSKRSQDEFRGRVAFALGTGRSGTHFIAHLFADEPNVAAWHERHRLADSFHRYCCWYGLAVDSGGFIANKEAGIRADLENHAISLESNALLSLSVPQLFERFEARFALILRRPEKVVNSSIAKGLYATTPERIDPRAIPGYQPNPGRAHHPFGRFAPVGDEAIAWNAYTPIGKLSWYWRVLNSRTMELLEQLPETHVRVIRIEDFDYDAYQSFASFLGFSSKLDEAGFKQLVEHRPESKRKTRTVHSWSDTESAEFEQETRPLAEKLGYEWRVDELRRSSPEPARSEGGRSGVTKGLLARARKVLSRSRDS
jgi:hypothetical protein